MNILGKRRVRYAVGFLAILAVGVLLKHWFFPSNKPPAYITATATLADIDQTVLASGTLAPFEVVSVGAQVSGQVKVLNVKLGDKVVKGQTIAMIDSLPQENALRTAEAALAQARAQLAVLQATLKQDELALERQKRMLAQDASSQADFESADAAASTARANILATEAQIAQAVIAADTAKVNLDYTKITSPIDGEVVAVAVKQGQTVNSVQAAPTIVKVAKLDVMTVKAQISEADVIRVVPGQKVWFTILGDAKQRYYARLRAIEPAPESFASETGTSAAASSSSTTAAVYYNALFDIANPVRRLRTSMTAQVNVVIADAKNVVTVSSNALSFETDAKPDAPGAATANPAGSTWATVRVLDATGTAQPRRVRVGINNSINAQILESLASGERVVISDAADAAAAAKGQPRPGM